MFKQSLEEYPRHKIFLLGLGTGMLLGACAGIFASIIHSTEPVDVLVYTAIIACFLVSWQVNVSLSIGLATGLGIGLSIEMLAVNTSTLIPEMGISVVVIGLFSTLFGWGLQSLHGRKDTKKSA